MATFRNTLRTMLEGDSALALILTGGVFGASELGYDGGGADYAPRESNGVIIKPHAVIRYSASAVDNPHHLAPEIQAIEIHLYQQVGYDKIDSAVARIRALLHEQYLTCDDLSFCHLLYTYRSPDTVADELQGASHVFTRYIATILRK